MSLLAGFDVALEISRGALLRLLMKHLKLGGRTGRPPPYDLDIPGSPFRAHLIITGLELDLLEKERVLVTAAFANGSIQGAGVAICPLAGQLRITAPIALTPVGKGMSVGIEFFSAEARVELDPESRARVLARVPLPNVFDVMNEMATNAIRQLRLQALNLPLDVVPGKDGSLGDPSTVGSRFERVQLHTLPHADRNRQALVLFGILLVKNHHSGNPAEKEGTALSPGQDVAISISPEAFHHFIFCQGLRIGFEKKTVSELPPPCGGGWLDVSGVKVTRLADSFDDGHINIDGNAEKSGDCYDATASFHGEIELSLSANTLAATTTRISRHIRTDVKWYCAVLGFLAAVFTGGLGLLAAAVGGVVTAVLSSKDIDKLDQATSAVLGKPFAIGNIGELAGVSFKDIAVTRQGLTLRGVLPIALSWPDTPYLGINASVTPIRTTQKEAGIFRATTGCPQGEYGYTELLHEQRGQVWLSPSLFGKVYTTEWWLEAGGTTVRLTGEAGTATLSGVRTRYPMPLPGGSAVVQDVHLQYEARNQRVALRNRPEEGVFAVTVRARCTDCVGNVLENSFPVLFTGDTVILSGDYYADVEECFRRYLDEKVGLGPKERWIDPPPINYPPIDRVLELINAVATPGSPEADAMVQHIAAAYGNAFSRAALAPSALLKLPAPVLDQGTGPIVR